MEMFCLTAATRSSVAGLDLLAADLHVGGDEIDVQLQGVGPGFLDQLRVADPAAVGDAVEAADHRDLDRLLGLLRSARDSRPAPDGNPPLGEVREGLGEAVGPELMDAGELHLVVLDLLLEQRGEHDRGRARPLPGGSRLSKESLKGQAATTSGFFELQAQIVGLQVDSS